MRSEAYEKLLLEDPTFTAKGVSEEGVAVLLKLVNLRSRRLEPCRMSSVERATFRAGENLSYYYKEIASIYIPEPLSGLGFWLQQSETLSKLFQLLQFREKLAAVVFSSSR